MAPMPPYQSRSDPVPIPAPLPPQGHSISLTQVLVGVVLLHFCLSVRGFIYLYHNDRRLSLQLSSGEGETAFVPPEKQETSYKTLARMVAEQRSHTSDQKSASSYLQWDMNHSFIRGINYYHNSWLTILQPGHYYVYSRVTFSKDDSVRPLVSRVMLRKNETGEEKVVMLSYCSLDSNCGFASIPHLCTATQGEVITLERGNQLSVWVHDMSLVNYEEGATTFGMYRL